MSTFTELYFIASPQLLAELEAALNLCVENNRVGIEMRQLRNLVEGTLYRSGQKPASQKCLVSIFTLQELEAVLDASAQSSGYFWKLAVLADRVRGALGMAA